MANDQFLEAQRLQIMDMRRMQSVLTSEQQRQISEMKRKDEQKLELERQIKRNERKDEADSKSLEGNFCNIAFSASDRAFCSLGQYKGTSILIN